jgi:hypothetical protein
MNYFIHQIISPNNLAVMGMSKEKLFNFYSFTKLILSHPPSLHLSTLRLQEEPGHGQLKIGGLTRCVSMRRVSTLCSPLTPLHPF